MKLITSWDDSHKLDVGLSLMLEEFKIPAIFYVPGQTPSIPAIDMLSEDGIRDLSKKGFEIGGHTYKHPDDLKLLDDEELRKEIVVNRDWLEKLIGKKVTKFCYPSGRYNEKTIEVLKEAGFKEARTTVVMNTDIPKDPFRVATTVHVYPNRVEYKGRPWLEVARELYKESLMKENGYFHLWGHSWEIEKFNLWEELETLFKEISNDAEKWKPFESEYG